MIVKTVKKYLPSKLLVIYRKWKASKEVKETTNKLLIENNSRFHMFCCNIQQTKDIDLPNVLKISNENYKYPLYIRNDTTDVILYRNIIEKLEYNFTASNQPNVIIDAGANIGLAGVYFANKYPNSKIISIEPEEENFKLLKENTQNYPNIIALQCALWNEVGEVELLDVGRGNWAFMTGDGPHYDEINALKKIQKKYSVKTVTIEGLLEDYNLGLIDILKIDIEGAEKEVFENYPAWVNHVQSIIVELHERMKKGCNEAFKKVEKEFDESAINGEDIYLSKGGFIKMI